MVTKSCAEISGAGPTPHQAKGCSFTASCSGASKETRSPSVGPQLRSQPRVQSGQGVDEISKRLIARWIRLSERSTEDELFVVFGVYIGIRTRLNGDTGLHSGGNRFRRCEHHILCPCGTGNPRVARNLTGPLNSLKRRGASVLTSLRFR